MQFVGISINDRLTTHCALNSLKIPLRVTPPLCVFVEHFDFGYIMARFGENDGIGGGPTTGIGNNTTLIPHESISSALYHDMLSTKQFWQWSLFYGMWYILMQYITNNWIFPAMDKKIVSILASKLLSNLNIKLKHEQVEQLLMNQLNVVDSGVR